MMNTFPGTPGFFIDPYTYAVFAVIFLCVVLCLRAGKQIPGGILLPVKGTEDACASGIRRN